MQCEDMHSTDVRKIGDECEDYMSKNIDSLNSSRVGMLSKQEKIISIPMKNDSIRNSFNYCFYADTPKGTVILDTWPSGEKKIHLSNKSIDVLNAAYCLGHLEELICLLEDWLNLPLDFELFTPIIYDLNSVRVEFLLNELSVVSNIVENAILHLPCSLVAQATAVAPGFSNAMRWSRLACKTIISHIEVPHQKATALQSGGMLLIPSSFEELWLFRLRNQITVELACVASIDTKYQALKFERCDLISVETVPINRGSQIIHIEFREPLAVPVDFLAGWGERPVFYLDKNLSEFEVVVTTADGIVALGHLLRIGDGYGILINSVKK